MTHEIALYLPEPPESVRPSLQGTGAAFAGLAPFITYYVSRQQKKRDADIQKFAQDVITVVNNLCAEQREMGEDLKNKIDEEHFWSDDFFRVFRRALEHHVTSPDDAKRAYIVDFVLHYARERRPDVTLESIFWQHVSALTGTHFALLHLLYKKQSRLNTEDLGVLRNSPQRTELLSLRSLISDLSIDQVLLECLLADLLTRRLVEQIPGPVNHEDPTPRILFTPPGQSLMRFIFGDWE